MRSQARAPAYAHARVRALAILAKRRPIIGLSRMSTALAILAMTLASVATSRISAYAASSRPERPMDEVLAQVILERLAKRRDAMDAAQASCSGQAATRP
jgi:hypothetical protein